MLSLNILFPVFNEEKRLRKGIEVTCRYLEEHFQCPYLLTIIDNGSTDLTEEISHCLCTQYNYVRYIKTLEKGVGIAFRTGIETNSADIVGYMDIDLSTDLSHLSDMYEIFCKQPEVEIVNASRWNKKSDTQGRKWYRNFTSHGWVFVLKWAFGIKATDAICGFKFFRKETVEMLVKEAQPDNGWFYVIELLIRAERKNTLIYELPVHWVDDYNTTVHVKRLVVYYLKKIFHLKKVLRKEQNKYAA